MPICDILLCADVLQGADKKRSAELAELPKFQN